MVWCKTSVAHFVQFLFLFILFIVLFVLVIVSVVVAFVSFVFLLLHSYCSILQQISTHNKAAVADDPFVPAMILESPILQWSNMQCLVPLV